MVSSAGLAGRLVAKLGVPKGRVMCAAFFSPAQHSTDDRSQLSVCFRGYTGRGCAFIPSLPRLSSQTLSQSPSLYSVASRVVFIALLQCCFSLHAAPAPSQDFQIELRVHLDAGRRNATPLGRNPCTVAVKDGKVDLKPFGGLIGAKRVPPGERCKFCMDAIVQLHNFTFRDFLVSLHNIGVGSHGELASVLFSQAVLRLSFLVASVTALAQHFGPPPHISQACSFAFHSSL